jgi:nucleotide-binding universal stress UspA family protein
MMYETILVTLEATATDRPLIDHVKKLARAMNSNLLLLHIAMAESARRGCSPTAANDLDAKQVYLRQVRDELEAEGIPVRARLVYGDPVSQIINRIEQNGCDLVAMSIGSWCDIRRRLLLGITAGSLQRNLGVPILLPTAM